MVELDNDIRLFIEKTMDTVFDDPNSESKLMPHLLEMGIEPNLETTLSYITGLVMGGALGVWVMKRPGRSEEEETAFSVVVMKIVSRRAMELRQHFIKSRQM